MADANERINTIERDLAETVRIQQRNERFLERFSREMDEFKSEMRTFQSEMKDFKSEMLEFKSEMKDFKDEMKGFKSEMLEFKDEMRESKREMDRKWGDLANKLGTVVEDIIAPGLPGVLRSCFGVDPDEVYVRYRIRHPRTRDRVREFDIVAVGGERIFLNETKSNPRLEYAREFVESLDDFFEWLPRYRHLQLVPIFSSLSLPDDVIAYLSDRGVYAMMLGEDHLEIVNLEDVGGEAAGSP